MNNELQELYISNDRLLIEYYFTLNYMRKLLDEEKYYLYDEDNLSNYYLPVMKGMINRCIRRDQKDWQFVQYCFNFEYDNKNKNKNKVLKLVEIIEGNINLLKIDKSKVEFIKNRQKLIISKLRKEEFEKRLLRAMDIILIAIKNRYLDSKLNMDLIEFAKSEYATKIDFSKIKYKSIINSIETLEEGLDIKEVLFKNWPKGKGEFYKKLVNIVQSNEELDIIREHLEEDNIQLNIPKNMDEKIKNIYDRCSCRELENYIEKYISFEEAWNNRSILLNNNDIDRSKIYGSLLLKTQNDKEIKLVNYEIEKSKVKFSRGDKYHKLLQAIRNSNSLETAIVLKNRFYKEGLLADLKLYNVIIEKYKETDDVSGIIKERNLHLRKEVEYEQLINNIESSDSFDECVEYKNIAYSKGIKLDNVVYGLLLGKAKNSSQVSCILNEVNNLNIKFKTMTKKQYENIKNIDNFNEAINYINNMYRNGRIVDKIIYLMVMDKATNDEDIDYIKNQIDYRFSKIITPQYMKQFIIYTSNIDEILLVKEKFESHGNILEKESYNELLYKCRRYEQVKDLCNEMIRHGFKLEYSNYLNLIGLCYDFDEAYNWKNKMLENEIQPDIKIYHKLIKKCHSGKKVIDLLKEMRSMNIHIDDKLREIAISKVDDLDQVKYIKSM